MTSLNYFSAMLQWMGSLAILFLCLHRWKYLSKDMKAVGLYGGLSFFFQLLQIVSLLYFNSRFNNPVANIYSPVELFSLLLIYYHTPKLVAHKKVLTVLGLVLCIFVAGISASNLHTLNGISETIRDITLIVCSLFYFIVIMKEMTEENLLEAPMFWVNASILFFFSCTLILSLFMDYILALLRDDFISFWIFRNLLRTGFCLVICLGIWKVRMQTPLTLPKNTMS